MPVLEGPCPPCKIILNGGFIAALAPMLIEKDTAKRCAVFHAALIRLRDTTTIYLQMLSVIGVTVAVGGEWEGCDQAKQLVEWINESTFYDDADAATATVKEWTADIWSAISDLADGKVPKLT